MGSNSAELNINYMDDSKQSNKRSRRDSGTDPVSAGFPRFLVIQGSDPNKPLKLSPFAVSKGVESLAGSVKSIQRLRSGDILVEVERAAQASNLLKAGKFVDTPVKVSPHRTLNSCKGVVRCPELRDCDSEEILEELADQQVIDVYRVMVTQDGIKKPTNTLFLTFNRPSIPQYIKVGYLRVKVDFYIPNPIRCFGCQRFGHFKSYCRRGECCEKCGRDAHEGSACQGPVRCVNCDGDHPANSRACPKWIEEKRVQEIKTKGSLSYPEARRLYQTQHAQGSTYADRAKQVINNPTSNQQPKAANQQPKAARQPGTAAATQTDLTWLSGGSPVLLEVGGAAGIGKQTQTKLDKQFKQQCDKQGGVRESRPSAKTGRPAGRGRSLSQDPPVRHAPPPGGAPTTGKPARPPDVVRSKTPKVIKQKQGSVDPIMSKNKFDVLESSMDLDIPSTIPSPKTTVVKVKPTAQ